MRLPAVESVKRGNGLRSGTAMATMRLTKSAAKCGEAEIALCEGRTMAQPQSNLRCKSLAKQNQQNIFHVEP